ncbi:MAG: hypothetical protein KY395_06645, partial [Actinobacteria bacterium]|nr:hypothetical protein [Actinomycetota bacterium]
MTRGASPPVAVLLALAACGSTPEVPRIEDASFTAAAREICAEVLPPLRADVSDDTPRQPGEVAPTVESRADSLEELVGDLRALEVEESARAEVEAWLEDWER